RQVVVRAVLIGEQRVAAVLRHLDRIEQRGARRDVEVGVIGVEISARIGEADRLAVLLAVRKDQDVCMLAMMELIDDVRLRTAELPREAEELTGAQALAADDQHLRGEERVPDLAKRPCDAVCFRTETTELCDLHTKKGSEQFSRNSCNRKIALTPFPVML